jgi:signal transduction histidine kinase/ActR/RegA family two-component response regulator
MEAGLLTPTTALVLLALTTLAAAWLAGAASERTRARPQPPAAPVAEARAAPGEAAPIDMLGLSLSGQLDIAQVAKAVTDVGVAVTGAAFGAFVYTDEAGSPTHYVTGVEADASIDFPAVHEIGTQGAPFRGAVARSDDLEGDPHFGAHLPFLRMPAGQRPARSYLMAAVHSSAGVLRGGLFLGHPEPGRFREADERLLGTLTAHAAIAADNAHLYREARVAREAAEAANHANDAFLVTLSHELRTPLTAIVGWTNLLQMGRLDPEETTRAIDTILRNATAQTRIIDELLDVSRIISGKLLLDLGSVEVGAIVKGAVESVTRAATAKGIHLQLVLDPAGSWIAGDPERLQQVFWNLLFNAVKFTPPNGRVRVGVHSIGSSVEVVVDDTGVGIEPEFLPRMFERFTQGDSSSTRSVRGLGIGLSIARQLAELHGGTIRAESAGLGYGATFIATFPRSPGTGAVLDSRALAPGNEGPDAPEMPRLDGVRALVVEDDDDARALLQKVLTGQGALVRSAASAAAALELLGRERVDVLLSDIEMAGTDGYQLVRELRLRTVALGGAVPALALSAYTRTEDRLRALRAGFQVHLSKPVQPSKLVAVVASLAARGC